MNIQTARIYDHLTKRHHDYRVLVEHSWPHKLTEEEAQVDMWASELAPSPELHKWYNEDPEKWHEFKQRYFSELVAKEALLSQIIEKSHAQTVILLYSNSDENHNNAVVLQEFLNKY